MNYQILQRGGIGDYITILSRLNSLLKPGESVRFVITGGFPAAIRWNVELLSADRRVTAITDRIVGNAGKILDWRPDFASLGYPIQIPFITRVPNKEKNYASRFFLGHEIDPEKAVILHPLTTEGNNQGFERERHWKDWEWLKLIQLLDEAGYVTIQIGSESDTFLMNATYNLVGKTSLLESIALILKARFTIDINSWVFQVAAYACHPTIALWFSNHHWIPLHVPDNLDTLAVFQNRDVTAEEVFERLMKLGEIANG